MSLKQYIRNALIRGIGSIRPSPVNGSEPVYRFLTYHRIKPDQQLSFKHQLRRLKNNYNFVTPTEFENDEGKTDELNLLLTFDDGYLEWETVVLQTLKKFDIKAIFFVNPDFVGLNEAEATKYCENNLDISPALPLTTDGFRKIQDAGHIIGNHLIEHFDLRNETSSDRFDRIFKRSQDVFDQTFNMRPEWVSYPFADYFKGKDSLIESASDYFKYGVTLIPGSNTANSEQLYLHRDGFSPDYTASLEKAWLNGGYDPVFTISHLMPQFNS